MRCITEWRSAIKVMLAKEDSQLLVDPLLEDLVDHGGFGATTLDIPLDAYPEARRIIFQNGPGGGSYLFRLSLKPATEALALRTVASRTPSDTCPDVTFMDEKSDYLPAEVVTISPQGVGKGVRVQQGPHQEEGFALGAQTMVLSRNQKIQHGDPTDVFYSEYDVTIDQIPLLCRLDLDVEHLNILERAEVYVNGKVAGQLMLMLPDLESTHYMIFQVNKLNEAGTRMTPEERFAFDYGTWASAWLVFSPEDLRVGKNSIRIGKAGRLSGTNDDYAFRNLRLQLKYE